MTDPDGRPGAAGHGLVPARRRWAPPWASLLAVGALAGVVPPVVVDALLRQLVQQAVPDRPGGTADVVLALLLVGPFVLPVVVLVVLGTTVVDWLALRLLGVPRALAVAGVSGLVLLGAATALVYNGAGDLQLWWCALASAALHGVVGLLVLARGR